MAIDPVYLAKIQSAAKTVRTPGVSYEEERRTAAKEVDLTDPMETEELQVKPPAPKKRSGEVVRMRASDVHAELAKVLAAEAKYKEEFHGAGTMMVPAATGVDDA